MSNDPKCPQCGSRDYGPGPNFDNLRWIGCYKCGYGFKSDERKPLMNDKWISTSEYTPDVCKRVLGWNGQKRDVVFYGTDSKWYSDDKLIQYEITHWQPLPDPPKQESSFETFWQQWSIWRVGTALKFQDSVIHENAARMIWDAAIAASKQPDFVE